MVTRLVHLSTVAIAALLAAGAPAQIPNPDFDQGEYTADAAPPGWAWRLEAGGKGAWETEGRTGRCISLENVRHEDGATAVSDAFPVTPGHNYRFSFHHRARDPISWRAEAWVYLGDPSYNSGYRFFTTPSTREWQQRTIEFTTPSDLDQTRVFFVLSTQTEDGKWFIDDLELEDLGPAKVTTESIDWELIPTSILTQVGSIFTPVDGPKTSRPITTVIPRQSIQAITTTTPAPLIVDGLFGAGEYEPWASSIGPLRDLAAGVATSDETYAWVTCDQMRLYIAWRATFKGDAPATAVGPEQRDGPTHNDDCVEVLLQPPDGPMVHLIGNSAGAIYDDRTDPGQTQPVIEWDGAWEYKTSVERGAWLGEAAIAWSEIGLSGPPADGSEWLFEIARTSPSHSVQCKWTYLPGVAGFCDPKYMGRLRFDSSGCGFCLRPLTSRLGRNSGVLYVPASIHSGGSLIRAITILDDTGAEVYRLRGVVTPNEGNLTLWGFDYDLPRQITYTLSMSVQDPGSGEEVFELTVPLDARPDLQVDAKVLPLRKKLIIDADTSRTGIEDAAGNRLVAALVGETGTIREAAVPRIGTHSFHGGFGIEDVPPGSYRLTTRLSDAEGREIALSSRDVLIAPTPEWFGNTLGKSDVVLPPFTPVRAGAGPTGVRVSLWNREYDFGAGGLPTQLRTAGEQMLAAPASVALICGGQSIDLKLQPAELASSTDTAAVVAAPPAVGGPSFSSTTTTEFDGMMKLDFTLDPGPGPLVVDRFTLSFPFVQRRALYCNAPVTAPPFHHTIDHDGWRLDRRISPADIVYGRFWVGDDDRGVDFSFTSDEGWRPYDRPDIIQIDRRGDVVNVDIHVLGSTVLDRPLTGTLLVTATPLRPLAGSDICPRVIAWDGRPMQVLQGVDSYGREGVQACADLGGKVLLLSDHWSSGFGRPEPYDPHNFKLLTEEAHRLGLKVITYTGIGGWSETAPERPYMDEWEQVPMGRSANAGRPDQAFMAICQTDANGGHDCLVWMLDRMIDEYGLDGIYLDGHGWTCNSSMLNGFGYLDDEGKVRPTATILQTRALLRRIATLFHEHGKQMFFEHHSTWLLAGPVDPYTNVHMTGEYAAQRANENTPFPEDFFRIENTGIQWGIPVDVLCYRMGLWDRYVANCLIYGARPQSPLGSFAACYPYAPLSPLWHACDDMGLADAEWIPYWKAEGLVSTDTPQCRVSLFRHPRNGILLIAGNISHEPTQVTVTLDLEALGIDGGAAVEAINKPGAELRLDGGVLRLSMAGDEVLMARVVRR
ncbi:MAG TPA: hypothetical protein DGT21_10470 [Armatimonadetes bacterium]|nr:hypothetical protein [Armatimonadota bacterium]